MTAAMTGISSMRPPFYAMPARFPTAIRLEAALRGWPVVTLVTAIS
jgi:hypothetical protein